MITIRLLGQIDIRDASGDEVRSLLRQPKRVALLAYLAIAKPPGFQQRDKLFGLFWSESTQEQARHSLNQSLHLLRRELGKDAIVTRGDGAISIAKEIVATDVSSFEEAIQRGDYEAALKAYGGDLMDGFFVSEAFEFERWMSTERVRLREQAADAAWALAFECISSDRLSSAERNAQRAVVLLPTDESQVRRFIRALASAGDRAAAVRFYERFAERLRDEFQLEPSDETQLVAQALRVAVPTQPSADLSPVRSTSTEAAADGSSPANPRVLRRKSIMAAVATVAVVCLVLISGALLPGSRRGELDPAKVLVVPFENRTGDPRNDDWGEYASALISRGVERSTGVAVVSSAAVRDLWETTRVDHRGAGAWLATQTGAGTAVRGHYRIVENGCIRFEVEIFDVRSSELITALDPVEGPADSVDAVLTVLLERMVAAVALQFDSEGLWGTDYSNPPTLEAYREYMTCSELFDRGIRQEALRHCLRAIEIDSLWPPPIIAAGYLYGTIADRTDDPEMAAKSDSVFRHLNSLSDRLTLAEQYEVDYAVAMLNGDLEAELQLAREVQHTEVQHEGYPLGRTAIRTNRPHESLAALRSGDTTLVWVNRFGGFWTVYVLAAHQIADYELELTLARAARRRLPDRLDMLDHEVRALIAMDSVGAMWRLLEEARSMPPPGTPARSLQIAAKELRFFGHSEEAEQVLQESIQSYRELLASTPEDRELLEGLANSLYLAGVWDESESLCLVLSEEHPHAYRYLGRLGSIAARRGDRDSALVISDSLAAMDWRWRQADRSAWRARIAAVLGDERGAVSLLRQAIDEGLSCCRRLATDVDLQLLSDYAPFVEVMRPKG